MLQTLLDDRDAPSIRRSILFLFVFTYFSTSLPADLDLGRIIVGESFAGAPVFPASNIVLGMSFAWLYLFFRFTLSQYHVFLELHGNNSYQDELLSAASDHIAALRATTKVLSEMHSSGKDILASISWIKAHARELDAAILNFREVSDKSEKLLEEINGAAEFIEGCTAHKAALEHLAGQISSALKRKEMDLSPDSSALDKIREAREEALGEVRNYRPKLRDKDFSRDLTRLAGNLSTVVRFFTEHSDSHYKPLQEAQDKIGIIRDSIANFERALGREILSDLRSLSTYRVRERRVSIWNEYILPGAATLVMLLSCLWMFVQYGVLQAMVQFSLRLIP